MGRSAILLSQALGAGPCHPDLWAYSTVKSALLTRGRCTGQPARRVRFLSWYAGSSVPSPELRAAAGAMAADSGWPSYKPAWRRRARDQYRQRAFTLAEQQVRTAGSRLSLLVVGFAGRNLTSSPFQAPLVEFWASTGAFQPGTRALIPAGSGRARPAAPSRTPGRHCDSRERSDQLRDSVQVISVVIAVLLFRTLW